MEIDDMQQNESRWTSHFCSWTNSQH